MKGEEKVTSVFYSDTDKSSIGKETMSKTFAIGYCADKYNEEIAINNFKTELVTEIKQHLTSTESSKTSEKNYFNEYLASLKVQMESAI